MVRPSSGGKEVPNISNEIVELGVSASTEKVEGFKQSYEAGWGIDPENNFQHPNDHPTETGKWGAFTMGIPTDSPIYGKCVLDYSDGSSLHLLNKDFDSLITSAA